MSVRLVIVCTYFGWPGTGKRKRVIHNIEKSILITIYSIKSKNVQLKRTKNVSFNCFHLPLKEFINFKSDQATNNCRRRCNGRNNLSGYLSSSVFVGCRDFVVGGS